MFLKVVWILLSTKFRVTTPFGCFGSLFKGFNYTPTKKLYSPFGTEGRSFGIIYQAGLQYSGRVCRKVSLNASISQLPYH